jgi:hypothetical protein
MTEEQAMNDYILLDRTPEVAEHLESMTKETPAAKPKKQGGWASILSLLAMCTVYQGVHAWTDSWFGYGLSIVAAITVALLTGIFSWAAAIYLAEEAGKKGTIFSCLLIALGFFLVVIAPKKPLGVWPLKETMAVGPVATPFWTAQEKQEFARFKAMLETMDEDAVSKGAGKKEEVARRATRTVLAEAKIASDKTLAKMHPGLPAAFREKLVPGFELLQKVMDSGFVSQDDRAKIEELTAAWDNWWVANGRNIRAPN